MNDNEKRFYPDNGDVISFIVITIIVVSAIAAYVFAMYSKYYNNSSGMIVFVILAALFILLFLVPIIFRYIKADKIYINKLDNCLRIGNKIIFLSEIKSYSKIANIKYNFFDGSIGITQYHINLYSGEKIYFEAFFRSGESDIKSKFKKINILCE